MTNYMNYRSAKEIFQKELQREKTKIRADYKYLRWGTYWDTDIALIAVGCALIGYMLLPPIIGFIIGGLAGYTYMVEKKGRAAQNQMIRRLQAVENEYYSNLKNYNGRGGGKWW